MEYGHFDEKNKEYVITRPDTPTPWINYLGLDEYCAIISNTAGGFRVKRIFRQAMYDIKVGNPRHLSKGIDAIFIDGKKIEGNILPRALAGSSQKVEVVMGRGE